MSIPGFEAVREVASIASEGRRLGRVRTVEDGSRTEDGERCSGDKGWVTRLVSGHDRASTLRSVIDERTVDIRNIDEDEFFSTDEGHTTLTNRYDLEKAIPTTEKRHLVERQRYWVNEPYAFVIIFHSVRDNETKYHVIEPHMTPTEERLVDVLAEKLRRTITYRSRKELPRDTDRAGVIRRETRRLLKRYALHGGVTSRGVSRSRLFGAGGGHDGVVDTIRTRAGQLGWWPGQNDGSRNEDAQTDPTGGSLRGIAAGTEPASVTTGGGPLSEYQVEKLIYRLRRDFVGYERIDPIKHDVNVEDISCDGYDTPVFVYHTDHEQLITNVSHGGDELDDFVIRLAQRSGKGISKREPQVDATLPDGSRAQLTLGREVSDHGTNYTIRQFKDIPFTPVDLVNWRTFSIEQMAFLWLAIENGRNLVFAGGTASGKTTSLNAVSLFIPSNAKIVSIEDTREVELPQRNWIASVTRPSFAEDGAGDIDEFNLLEAALRQRPDYIVMGEVRGEEGRDLFQVMSTGHTTYTTFHADSVDEVIKRFTTDPINVSKTLFTALDLVSIQTQTRVGGRTVRRSTSITEINEYSPENDEINVRDVYRWRAESDEFDAVGRSNVLENVGLNRGWDREKLDRELRKRRIVLAYLIRNGLNDYAQVAATVQSFIADPGAILGLIASDELEGGLGALQEMERVEIDVDPGTEAMVPRPDPAEEVYETAGEILREAADGVLAEHRNTETATDEPTEVLAGAVSDAADDTTGPGRGV